MSTHITGPHDAKRHTTLYRTYSINTHQWSFRKTGTSGFGNAGEPSGNRCLGPTTGGGGRGLRLCPHTRPFAMQRVGRGRPLPLPGSRGITPWISLWLYKHNHGVLKHFIIGNRVLRRSPSKWPWHIGYVAKVSCRTSDRFIIIIIYKICQAPVGGVAQWLGCRSLAGGLSLIYAWSMVDTWTLRG